MAQAGLPAWSQTASSNSTADPNINWAEGQSPSSVNDSARAMMAALAKWRDDNNGTKTTGGTSTAYTVTTNQTFDSLAAMSGQTLRLRFNATNGASPTLNVDGLGAKAIQSVVGTAVPTGAILANTTYDLVYDNSSAVWLLINPSYSALIAPSGTKMVFGQTAAPSGWTKDTTHDNKALRLVTGAVGTGGVNSFTSVFTTRTITQAMLPNVNFTVTIPAGQGSHVHDLAMATGAAGANSFALQTNSVGGNVASVVAANTLPQMTGTAASGGSGTAIEFDVQYVDVILATKD